MDFSKNPGMCSPPKEGDSISKKIKTEQSLDEKLHHGKQALLKNYKQYSGDFKQPSEVLSFDFLKRNGTSLFNTFGFSYNKRWDGSILVLVEDFWKLEMIKKILKEETGFDVTSVRPEVVVLSYEEGMKEDIYILPDKKEELRLFALFVKSLLPK